jgi:hypothetical protein
MTAAPQMARWSQHDVNTDFIANVSFRIEEQAQTRIASRRKLRKLVGLESKAIHNRRMSRSVYDRLKLAPSAVMAGLGTGHNGEYLRGELL